MPYYTIPKKTIRFLFITSLVTAIASISPSIFARKTIAEIPTGEPTGARWLKHVEEDLNPWWNSNTSLGDPPGNFPSFRCMNGEPLKNPSNPCPAFTNLDLKYQWLENENVLDKNYIVSQSRQVYSYGVAYHLTGNPQFLSLAKSGIDWIGNELFAAENNGEFKKCLEGKNRIGQAAVLSCKQSGTSICLTGHVFLLLSHSRRNYITANYRCQKFHLR